MIRKLKKLFRVLLTPERVNVNKGTLDTLWYSDEDTKKIWVDINHLDGCPRGAKYQHAQFPRELRHTFLQLNEDGTSTYAGEFTTTYPIDLVLAIYNDGGYTWDEAVILVANSCERCLNALAYQYGLSWGYPIKSPDWYKCGTSCVHCRGAA